MMASSFPFAESRQALAQVDNRYSLLTNLVTIKIIANEVEVIMEIMELLNSVMDKLKKVGGVELSFGNSQTVGDLTIIPVARVMYGFGGGSGTGGNRKKKKGKVQAIDETSEEMFETEHHDEPEKPKQEEVAMGGGGGGGMKTVPVGIFVFKGDKVRFYPVISFKETGIAIAIIFVMLWKLFKK